MLGQIHEIYFGTYIARYVKHGGNVIAGTGIGLADNAEAVSRAFDSDLLATILFILGGYLLISNTTNFKRLWIVIVMYIDFFICFTSATRGIFITYSIIVINLFYFLSKSSLLRARQITSMFVILLVALGGLQLLKQNDILSKQLSNATERLSSIGNYLDKDSNVAERENKRVDERIPKLMKHIKDSPIIGYGFTDEALEYADGHVGFHNQMIEGGILEVLIFLYFIFSVIMKVRRFTTGFRHGIQKNALRFYAYALLALLVVHGTSSQFFGFNIGFLPMQRWFMFTIFFVGLNVYYQDLRNTMNQEYIKQEKEKAIRLAVV
ncbi:MAG: O-antigen ligase family protein [Bacteroidales bacterium]|nr:O-antigen ligase family protein [Bacteroidales bacterium]